MLLSMTHYVRLLKYDYKNIFRNNSLICILQVSKYKLYERIN
jgi:hypothetical protein